MLTAIQCNESDDQKIFFKKKLQSAYSAESKCKRFLMCAEVKQQKEFAENHTSIV